MSIRDAAAALAVARVRYAETWLRFRRSAKSDLYATQQAIAETRDEITVLAAELRIAEEKSHRQS